MALRFTLYMIVVSMLNVEFVSAQSSFFNINGKTPEVTITQCADLNVTAGTNVTFIVKNVVTWELYRDNLRIFVKSNSYEGFGQAFDAVSVAVPPQAGTYKMTATFSFGQTTEFLPIVVLSSLTCPSKSLNALAMLSYGAPNGLQPKPGVITAFEGGGIYFSPGGLNLGGGGKTSAVYPGPQKVIAMLSHQGQVFTAFEGGGIYSSPDGQNLGGGGKTSAVYPGPQRVIAMLSYPGQNPTPKPQVITAFEGGRIYSSPDGLNLGGGGNTSAVYPGPQRVVAMLSYPGPNPKAPKPGVITAFEGGGIYFSPDGLNLGGGGSTIEVYPGPQRAIAMLSYPRRDPNAPKATPKPGVITAFEGGGIYFSPDGLNLGGGGSTIEVYPGPQKVIAMLFYPGDPKTPDTARVITAFESGSIYSSPDGLNLGGGGSTIAVYPGPLRVRAMLSYSEPNGVAKPRVITAFDGGGIYASPGGLNLGGGDSTTSVYP